jgi:hypothetical protein
VLGGLSSKAHILIDGSYQKVAELENRGHSS